MPVNLETLPKTMQSLSRVENNGNILPVPWFVQWVDGKPEFRAMDRQKLGNRGLERMGNEHQIRAKSVDRTDSTLFFASLDAGAIDRNGQARNLSRAPQLSDVVSPAPEETL